MRRSWRASRMARRARRARPAVRVHSGQRSTEAAVKRARASKLASLRDNQRLGGGQHARRQVGPSVVDRAPAGNSAWAERGCSLAKGGRSEQRVLTRYWAFSCSAQAGVPLRLLRPSAVGRWRIASVRPRTETCALQGLRELPRPRTRDSRTETQVCVGSRPGVPLRLCANRSRRRAGGGAIARFPAPPPHHCPLLLAVVGQLRSSPLSPPKYALTRLAGWYDPVLLCMAHHRLVTSPH